MVKTGVGVVVHWLVWVKLYLICASSHVHVFTTGGSLKLTYSCMTIAGTCVVDSVEKAHTNSAVFVLDWFMILCYYNY